MYPWLYFILSRERTQYNTPTQLIKIGTIIIFVLWKKKWAALASTAQATLCCRSRSCMMAGTPWHLSHLQCHHQPHPYRRHHQHRIAPAISHKLTSWARAVYEHGPSRLLRPANHRHLHLPSPPFFHSASGGEIIHVRFRLLCVFKFFKNNDSKKSFRLQLLQLGSRPQQPPWPCPMWGRTLIHPAMPLLPYWE